MNLSFLFSLFIFSYSIPSFSMEFEQLQNLVQKHKPNSVESLLPLLPEDLRSEYALIFQSSSLQKASRKDPRVVLFGNDGKTILAFNGGHNKSPTDTSIEIMNFNSNTQNIELRELEFPSGTFSQVNPPKCMTCHGPTNTHPNWPIYFSWPGMYGETDDTLADELNVQERLDFIEFKTKYAATHSRYSKLIFSQTHIEAPYGNAAPPYDSSRDWDTRPNAKLGALLIRYQSRQLFSQAQADPESIFSKYPYSYLGFSLCMHRFDEYTWQLEPFIERIFLSKFQKKSYPQFYSELSSYLTKYPSTDVLNLYIQRLLTGLQSSSWSLMPSQSIEQTYGDGISGGPDEYIFALAYQELSQQDPELAKYLKLKGVYVFPDHPFTQTLDKIFMSIDMNEARKACSTIRDKSKKEMNSSSL